MAAIYSNGVNVPPPPPPPPAAPSLSSNPSTRPTSHRKPEDDKGHRERERRGREKATAVSKHAVAGGAAAAAAGGGLGGRLRRDTPFLAHIRFKNDLPQIPCDPKMLVAQIQPERLAQFSLTSLERGMRRDLVVPSDLGVPISLLDIERYRLPDVQPELDPADAKLLGEERLGGRVATSGGSGVSGHLARPRAQKAEVSWLMRTTYISNDTDLSRRTGVGEKKAKAILQNKSAGGNMEARPDTAETLLETQIARIEATFEAAQLPPVHATNPTLTPVEVLPVFPDFEAWGLRYLVGRFDNDPTEEVDALGRLDDDIRGKVGARCMLKGFKLDAIKKPDGLLAAAQDGVQEKFMALVVPSAVDANAIRELPDDEDVSAEALEGEYQWVKEYSYTLQRKGEEDATYFLRLRDGIASYCDVYGDLDLKRRQGRNSAALADFQRPCKVTIRRRNPTDAEENERQQRLRRLNNCHEEDLA